METNRPVLKVLHYQVAGMAGLALVFAGELLQGLELANFLVAVVMDGTTAVTSGMCPLVSMTRPQHSLKPQRPSSPGAVGISRPVPARIC